MQIYNKYTVTIPNYPREIQISNSARAKYWYKKDDIPKKYGDITKFEFNKDDVLIDKSDGSKVVRNTKTAGKPRMLTINATKIYVGIHHSVRSKIVDELHKLFYSHFKTQLPSTIPIKEGNKLCISFQYYDVYNEKLPDLDNLSNLYIKCGVDCLTSISNPNQLKGSVSHKLGIIPDDKTKYVAILAPEFINVDKIEDRKLVVNIYEVSNSFHITSLLDEKLARDVAFRDLVDDELD